ncbi:HdeD family acid-resistance protein [Telmatocola sphagniphila]|uniref:HdeD family acid-resistance protein n=1 Tax=Telmatocola sphagniphila TaxID=1123043 RepID=A0A8E6B7W1_9BACT|nr:HdeD family acid-resistance protein [Telmatocola sphagniphila]QVL33507.1 HdeD family acid-resistance protein [Telmatocola sphagniphila]
MRGISMWLIVFGVLLVVGGIVALGSPLIFTITTVILFGWLLLIGGIAGLIGSILSKGWHGFAVFLLISILDIVVGFLMVSKPLASATLITLILAVLFLAGGIGRIISALVIRFPNWGWSVFSGFVSLILGGMIWGEWPESTIWVIGTFIGIEMIFRGWTWIALGSMVRKIVPPPTSATLDPQPG